MTTDISSPKLNDYEAQWDVRQPEEINYLRPTGFRFLVQTLPKVTYFCQSANIPQLSLGAAIQSTPLVDIPYPGEKLTFGELNVRFMIQEDMADYIELYNWLIGLGFPDSQLQYKKYTEEHDSVFTSIESKTGSGQFSDATLIVLGSNNMPTANITFKDCFPTSLSGLEFDISGANTTYFFAEAVFRYREFSVEVVI
jgi:hypothetical protein